MRVNKYQEEAELTVIATKRDDVSLNIPQENVPFALVDDELRSAMVPGVLVSFCDYPCRHVARTLLYAVSIQTSAHI